MHKYLIAQLVAIRRLLQQKSVIPCNFTMIRSIERPISQFVRCMTTSTESLLSHMHQHTCIVTLNRAKALNSLNTEMCVSMANLLKNPEHAAMIVKGAGGKAFCAGRISSVT